MFCNKSTKFNSRNDRTALLEMRQMIKREMKSNKEVMYEQFDLVKRGKVNTYIRSTHCEIDEK